MKCIICSKETKNENEICDKCQVAQRKKELKEAKKRLRQSKFDQVDYERDPEYGRMIYATGMRSGIISLVSSITALIFSLFILPGCIFGVLGLVEGIITIIDVIRNNRRGHKRMVPLAFGIAGVSASVIAFIIVFLSFLSVLIFLLVGTRILFLKLFF